MLAEINRNYILIHPELGGKGVFMSKAEKQREQVLLFDDFPSVSKEDWKKEAEKRVSYEDLIWHTEDGIEVEPFYTEEEAGDLFPGEPPLPGEFPFVRGTGGKNNSWLLTEEIRLAAAEETATAALAAIEGGADSLTFIPQAGMNRDVLETLVKEIDPLRVSMNFALRGKPGGSLRPFHFLLRRERNRHAGTRRGPCSSTP